MVGWKNIPSVVSPQHHMVEECFNIKYPVSHNLLLNFLNDPQCYARAENSERHRIHLFILRVFAKRLSENETFVHRGRKAFRVASRSEFSGKK